MRAPLHVMLAFLLGAAAVVGGSFALERGQARAEDPRPASVARRLAWPRTLDALPVWSAPSTEPETRKRTPSEAPATTRRFAVTFHHLHTQEVLPVEAEALPAEDELAFFLRCRATWEAHPIASAPVSVAVAMAREHGADRIEVISGFRSPKLNELLRKKGREVAPTSRHMSGEALDFRVPGVPAAELAASVSRTHVGGIGTYPVSNFVHVDVGPARRWRGR